ncbi:MAG: hypothetical protein AB7S77_11245 [Desulfatirhabdiaceae bacterium]
MTTLGEVSPLKPTREMIGYALWTGNPEKNTIQEALAELTGRSLITFRKYNNTYRIWEGSDIDINARAAEGERRTRSEVDLARMITGLAGDRRMVARRHSYDTGAFRFFSIAYANTPEEAAEMRKETFSSDGRIMVCLIETARSESDFIYLAENEQTSAQLFAIPQQIGPLQAVATELTALQWVQDNTPELRDDRAARRELALRIADATQME